MNIPIKLPSESIFTPEEIQQFRNDTPGCKHVIHLNNAGAGLMPTVVVQAQIDHLQLEAEIGGYEAAAFRSDKINEFYTEAALLFNCEPSNIAFTSSATDSYTRALSSIPFKTGDTILTDQDDFVSNQIQFLSLQKRFGINIIHINNADIGGVDVEDLAEKLRTYQPKLLAITHIPTNSGLIQPVQQIAEIFKTYSESFPGKTWYILDACQSAGQMKLDVQQLHCDFMSITCRKFLRGPRGTGALYISEKALHAGLEPLFIDMRGAEWIEKDQYKQQADARRFEDWEFAYSAVIGTTEAIRYCRKIGEDRIWQQVKLLSSILRMELLKINGVSVLDRGPETGGLVTFTINNVLPGTIVAALLDKKINVVPSYRAFAIMDFDQKRVAGAVRASPHYYTTLNEIEFFIERVREIAQRN